MSALEKIKRRGKNMGKRNSWAVGGGLLLGLGVGFFFVQDSPLVFVGCLLGGLGLGLLITALIPGE
jgi:hypothetical protein